MANNDILLAHREKTVAEQQKWLESTRQETEYMSSLINKMLELAKTPQEMMGVNVKDLAQAIYPVGFYENKAKQIIELSRQIVEELDGKVPDEIEDLIKFNGVGRKTANVVSAVGFDKDAIAVDTHVFRVSNRIGLVSASNPLNTEKGLMKILDQSDWSRAHHYLIYLGRSFCKAQKPTCENCPINGLCLKKIKR